MKKYKIVDRAKFIRFIVLVGLVSFIAIFSLFNTSAKTAEIEDVAVTDAGLERLLNNYDSKLVMVKSGDTFWTLQQKLLPNEDVRELKYYAEFLNGKQMGNLKSGEEIYLFTEKTEKED